MTKVFIIPGTPNAQVANELAHRIVLCGCEVVLDDHSSPLSSEEIEAGIARCDTLVVVATNPLDALAASAIAVANRRGKRVCAVWPPHATAGDLAEDLKDYADSILAWNSVNFCKVICDGELSSEGIDGGALPTPHNPHHRC